jgi:hypothetical protein
VEVSCEHGNEPSGSIKCWDYFLSDCAIGSFSGRAQLHECVSQLCIYIVNNYENIKQMYLISVISFAAYFKKKII